jgi:hypothetical protein
VSEGRKQFNELHWCCVESVSQCAVCVRVVFSVLCCAVLCCVDGNYDCL